MPYCLLFGGCNPTVRPVHLSGTLGCRRTTPRYTCLHLYGRSRFRPSHNSLALTGPQLHPSPHHHSCALFFSPRLILCFRPRSIKIHPSVRFTQWPLCACYTFSPRGFLSTMSPPHAPCDVPHSVPCDLISYISARACRVLIGCCAVSVLCLCLCCVCAVSVLCLCCALPAARVYRVLIGACAPLL